MSDNINHSSSEKKNNSWKIGCAIIGVIALCLGVFILLGGLVWLFPREDVSSEALTVGFEISNADLQTGDIFSITITLGNEGTKNVTVSEILLPNALLDHVRVISVSPESDVGVPGLKTTPFNINRTIAPTGRETIVFRFEALNSAGVVDEVVVKAGKKEFKNPVHIDIRGEMVEVIETIDVLPTMAPTGNIIPYKAVVQISAIVDIDGEEIEAWTGSGTVISKEGLILTNAHVVLSDRFYNVVDLVVGITTEPDQPPAQLFYADILQADAALDLAVIKPRSKLNGSPADFTSLGIEPVKIGNVDSLQLGDPIIIIGYPGIGGDTITLTRGEVSGFTYEAPFGNRAFIKTSGMIAGGNSGGLAATPSGEIIGVPSQVGSGDIYGEIVDCRRLADTNRDGVIDELDSCVPTGGFINVLRPINFALPLIEAAKTGEVAIIQEPVYEEGIELELEGDELLFDAFMDNQNGWFLDDFDSGWIDIINGELVINVDEENTYIYTTTPFYFGNIIMIVDINVLNPAGDGDFGFVCGYTDDENYSILEITEDGFYKIWLLENGETIIVVDWTASTMIPSSGPYTLAAYCGYDGFALAVNDSLLIDIDDYHYSGGYTGLFAGTWSGPHIRVGFDNFGVFEP